MFEHLDDPQPFAPGPDLQQGAVRRGRSLRRRRRLAVSSAAAVVLLVVGVVGAVGSTRHELDSVDTVDVPTLRKDTPPGDPKVVLFVGVDSDEGVAGAERTGPFRSDTIILARVDPGKETLTVLPLPRDLYLDIPGHGKGRINAAFAQGGPELLIDTIHQNLGVEVDHYVQTNFDGAAAIGDAIGGLELSFPTAMRDGYTGLQVGAGCTRLDGQELLQLGRSRHLQYLDAGRWRADPTSDLGRIERQQAIAQALLRRLSEVDGSNPLEATRLVRAVARHMVVDSATTTDELLGLFRGVSGSHDAPLRFGVSDLVTPSGAQVLELEPGWESVRAAFLDIDPPVATTTSTLPVPDHDAPGITTSTIATPTTTTTTVPVDVVSTPKAAIPTPC